MKFTECDKPTSNTATHSKYQELYEAVLKTASNGHAIKVGGLDPSEKVRIAVALTQRFRRSAHKIRMKNAWNDAPEMTIWAEVRQAKEA